MRILSIVGARPQFVKAAALSRRLRLWAEEILVHTGQHYDANMSGDFFRDLNLPDPEINLGVGSGTHGTQTAAMLRGLETVALENRPDLILIYGDTNSTVAGALTAAKLGIPLAHVEAGLRSFNRKMPEEVNRVVADRLSDQLYCPTPTAIRNLAEEGIRQGVHLVGDLMYDIIQAYHPATESRTGVLELHGLHPGEYAYMTLHRAENVDSPERLGDILDQSLSLGKPLLWPIHPRTKAALERMGRLSALRDHELIHIVEPLSYLDNLAALNYAEFLLTDSGGLQKEAAWLGVPCITLREETEWTETVEGGWNRLWRSGSLRDLVVTIRKIGPMPGESAGEAISLLLQANTVS